MIALNVVVVVGFRSFVCLVSLISVLMFLVFWCYCVAFVRLFVTCVLKDVVVRLPFVEVGVGFRCCICQVCLCCVLFLVFLFIALLC